MDKETFNKIFDQALDETSSFWDEKEIAKRIKDFSGSNSKKVKLNDAIDFVRLESSKYANQFVYNILYDLLVDDQK